MNSKKVVTVKHSNQSLAKPQRRSQLVQESVIESTFQQPEIEQPEPVVHLESLAEPTKDESVYGSGWSVTELLNEFSER